MTDDSPRLQDSERRLSMHKQVAIVLFVSASSMVLQSGVPGSLRLETEQRHAAAAH